MRRGTKAGRHALDTAWAASRVQGRRGAAGGDALRAFTLVELLVVIAVIGVLVTLLVAVGAQIVGGQKVSTTKNIMRNVGLAIDQFAAEDPLKAIYNSARVRNPNTGVVMGQTFGPYPPYQLANAGAGNSVAFFVEPAYPSVLGVPPFGRLGQRLNRDLRGPGAIAFPDFNWINVQDQNANDDVRALYAYLALYTPGVLSQIPEANIEPLVPGTAELVNPTGRGTNSGDPGAIDVLGIYDAWGVPLDYFLQVKLEYKVGADGITSTWVVTDRVPVLRSRGVSRELADAGRDTQNDWIFSEVFPQPAANRPNTDFRRTGVFSVNLPTANGWARAVGAGEFDGSEEDERFFGYVPYGP